MQGCEGAVTSIGIGEEVGSCDFNIHSILRFDLRIEHFVYGSAVYGVLHESVLYLEGIFILFGVVGSPVNDVVVHCETA